MRKIYKIERYDCDCKNLKPVYYENLVDLVESLAMSYYRVYVDGSEDLLNAIQAAALFYYPLFHKDMVYALWSSKITLRHTILITCVVSEVEVDQNGNLLSTSS